MKQYEDDINEKNKEIVTLESALNKANNVIIWILLKQKHNQTFTISIAKRKP